MENSKGMQMLSISYDIMKLSNTAMAIITLGYSSYGLKSISSYCLQADGNVIDKIAA